MADTQMLTIRITKGLHHRLKREARRKGQTLNAEILRRLDESFEQAERQETFLKKMMKDLDETMFRAAIKMTEHLADKVAEFEKQMEKRLTDRGRP